MSSANGTHGRPNGPWFSSNVNIQLNSATCVDAARHAKWKGLGGSDGEGDGGRGGSVDFHTYTGSAESTGISPTSTQSSDMVNIVGGTVNLNSAGLCREQWNLQKK